MTKRPVLSVIAKIFVPKGWFSSVTLELKYFMQEISQLNKDWDEVLPSTLKTS